MMLLNPWRMPLLFLISGVAIIFAAEKMGLKTLSWKRTVRLLVPLIFGVVFIVAPQSYYELLAKGEIQVGYLEFYQTYISGDGDYSVTVPTWNHLWYLVYLITYSLIVLPFVPVINRLAKKMDTQSFERLMGGGRIFLIPALLFVIYRFTTDIWFPDHTHALVDDWGAHAHYFSYFVVGMLIAKNQAFWRVLGATWRTGVVFVLVSGAIMLPMWVNWENWTVNQWFVDIIRAWRVIYAWAVIATVMGAAQCYLNRPSKRLSYLTEAVFPYYILHQTLIVVIGVAAASLGLPAAIEFLTVLVGTVLGCLLLHEFIIRRVVFLRPLFGLPLKPKQRQPEEKLQPAE